MTKPEEKLLDYLRNQSEEVNPKEVLFLLKNPQYERMPSQTFRQFIENPYCLGVGEDTWEVIKKEGDKIWSGIEKGKYQEAILLWGSGSGKSYLSAGVTLKFLENLLCLKNPHKFYGLGNDKPIAVVNMGTTATQAKNVIFTSMRKLIEGSKFFMEYNPEILTTEIRFAEKNIVLYCGNSQEKMPIGLNIIFGDLDEAAWYLDNEQRSVAQDIYNTMKNRIESRFGKRGFLMVISAPRYVDDFITRHYEKSRNTDYIYSSSFKTWEVKDRDKMSKETFNFVASKDEKGNPLEVWKGIPVDFKMSADSNPERFMRDFGARPSLVLEAFDRDAAGLEIVTGKQN